MWLVSLNIVVIIMFQGQHLQRGSHLVDFDIKLGNTMCVPVSLTDNQVDCRFQTKNLNDTICKENTLISVCINVTYTFSVFM